MLYKRERVRGTTVASCQRASVCVCVCVPECCNVLHQEITRHMLPIIHAHITVEALFLCSCILTALCTSSSSCTTATPTLALLVFSVVLSTSRITLTSACF